MSESSECIVVTGGTGFVGAHYLYRLIRRNAGVHVVAVVRGVNAASARARLNAQIDQAAGAYHDAVAPDLSRLHVVTGDISLPRCGVSAEALRLIGAFERRTVVHMAASLEFEEARRSSILRLNLVGTKNVLRLALALRAARFVYVSTAYTCGDVEGAIPESLHGLERRFNNAYEYSKCCAEWLTARVCERHGLAWAVLRPSIVVGPSCSHKPGGAETGLYGFVREISRLRRVLDKANAKLHLLGDPSCPVNLIPVDKVVETMVDLHREGYGAKPVHHLTGSFSPTVSQLLNVVASECGVPEFEMSPNRARAATPLERVFDKRLTFYSSYLRGVRHFETTDQVGVSANGLRLFVRASLEERQQRRTSSQLRRFRIASFDGFPLNVYEGGNPTGEPLVFVNALGVSNDILQPLQAELGDAWRLITWESRGVPSGDGELGPEQARFECHHRDLLAVAKHFGVGRFHVAGFCTGADVALHTASVCQERVISLALLNGAFCGQPGMRTEFQQTLWKVMPLLATSERTAAVHHALLFAGREVDSETTENWNQLLGTLDPQLLHLTSLPFRTPRNLFRYARLLQGFLAPAQSLRTPGCPCLVLTAENDRVTHPESSVSQARALGARLRSFGESGHFGLFTDASYRKALREFLRDCAVDGKPNALAGGRRLAA